MPYATKVGRCLLTYRYSYYHERIPRIWGYCRSPSPRVTLAMVISSQEPPLERVSSYLYFSGRHPAPKLPLLSLVRNPDALRTQLKPKFQPPLPRTPRHSNNMPTTQVKDMNVTGPFPTRSIRKARKHSCPHIFSPPSHNSRTTALK
jgi:hypothetical protein